MMYSSGDVAKIFGYAKTRQNIIAADKSGAIPLAKRGGGGRRGNARYWPTEQMPELGKIFGRYDPLPNPRLIAVSSFKGGVLKTGVAAAVARFYALNNIKTCVVGLDEQQSISLFFLNPLLADLRDWSPPPTVADFLDGLPLDQILKKTDLPTLGLVAESHSLSSLHGRLASTRMRHKSLDGLFDQLLKKFDLVVVDTSPSLNSLTECSLAAADLILCPAAAEVGCYSVLNHNLSLLTSFFAAIDQPLPETVIVPTLVNPTKVSKQIHAAYLSAYSRPSTGNICTSSASIARSVKGAEAEASGISPIEFAPGSPIADSYRELADEVFLKIGGSLRGD